MLLFLMRANMHDLGVAGDHEFRAPTCVAKAKLT
jgi:hypothetical protein